jgi:hypothetical protein
MDYIKNILYFSYILTFIKCKPPNLDATLTFFCFFFYMFIQDKKKGERFSNK